MAGVVGLTVLVSLAVAQLRNERFPGRPVGRDRGLGERPLAPARPALWSRFSFQSRPRLMRAQVGHEAGRLGAALLAWRGAGGELAHGVGAAS